MRKQAVIYLLVVLAIYPISLILAFFFHPAPIANIIGFFALLSYIATLLPSLIKAVFPSTKKNKTLAWLLKYRRYLGVAAFAFGLNHGVLQILKLQLNLLDFHTYIRYFQGFSTLSIFTLLAFTSCDEAVKSLKSNWKKLHRLTYLVIFILPWHILDKMSGHWSYITPIAVLLTLEIAGLFIIRLYKSRLQLSQIHIK
jgi:sulfoxide reductase heme-binding subunit YedZ